MWYKTVPVGRNTLAKQIKTIASFASLDGKFYKFKWPAVIQSLSEDFHLLEISELTGHANPDSISSYSHNPLEKQRKMSNKLAGFSSSTTTTVTQLPTPAAVHALKLYEKFMSTALHFHQLLAITQQQWITAVTV